VYTAEVLRADLGRPADLVAGVSVGALTALLTAQGRLARLRELWGEVNGTQFFQRPALDFNLLDGLYTMRPLRRRIAVEAPHPLQTELRIGLVDLRRKSYKSIRGNDLTATQLTDALIASCTQPGIHEETTYEGRKAGDGGLVHVMPNPAPLNVAQTVTEHVAYSGGPVPDKSKHDLANWTIHAVFCTPSDRVHQPPAGERVRSVTRALECLVDNVVRSDVLRLRTWASFGAEVYLYDPPIWPGDPFDAHRETIAWRLDDIGPAVWSSRRRL
jgi:predicted acylesterase/phospholipase RssA